MACTHTWKMYNKNYRGYPHEKKYYTIPCGKCLNCMLDKTQDLKMRCEEEFKNHKYNAFITLTYDDSELTIKENGIATLNYKDIQDFLKRLRITLDRSNKNEYLERNFKYLVVGEYGDAEKRPHYHMLMFGIDYLQAEKLIQSTWGKGWIKSLPILQGGIKYVLKYLTKSLNSKELYKWFEENKIEKPFCKHSIGLGRTLYEKREEEIKLNQGKIIYNNKLVPINRYYLNKILIKMKEEKEEIIKEMEAQKIKKLGYKQHRGNCYTDEQIREYTKQKNIIKERRMINEARQKGIPMQDLKINKEG